jgi:hypothetical protein
VEYSGAAAAVVIATITGWRSSTLFASSAAACALCGADLQQLPEPGAHGIFIPWQQA